MALRNGPAEFGLVTRVIHWAMMLLVIGQLALGNRIEEMAARPCEPLALRPAQDAGLCRSSRSSSPASPGTSPARRRNPLGPRDAAFWAARAAHWAFYVLLIAIPLTGWAGSSATGIDVMIADRWIVPPLVAPSAEGEAFWFRLHDILTKVLFGLIVLHMLGALKREMEGDGTLTRMLRGRV